MAEIIRLQRNFISKSDKQALESFGAHIIVHSHARRWCWSRDNRGDEVFEIFHGGARDALVVLISRDSELDSYCARDGRGSLIVTGTLAQVFTELDYYFALLHNK